MELVNLLGKKQSLIYSWLPHNLKIEKVIFLPDACPGKSPLPTGTAVLTSDPTWREFALSDVGCGMMLVKSEIKWEKMNQKNWDKLYKELKLNKGGLGELGGDNHFLDALMCYSDEYVYFLVHTGSRKEGFSLDELTDNPVKFDKEYEETVNWAYENRKAINDIIQEIYGPNEIILDLNHNNKVIIRKGAVRLFEDDLAIIPFHMTGDAILVRAKPKIEELLNAMSHGTGRSMSRGGCKEICG